MPVAKLAHRLGQVFASNRDSHEQNGRSMEQFENLQLERDLDLKPFILGIERKCRAAKTIEDLGFVPHEALLDRFIDRDLNASTDRYKMALELVEEIWPTLKPELILSIGKCLGDAKLCNQYSDAIDAYERGRDEACVAVGLAAMERAIRLAREKAESEGVLAWLNKTVSVLPCDVVGGYWSYLSWRFLTKKVYRGYASDDKANQGHYPKRNAVFHGLGSRVSAPLDSFNAILLANYVINLCSAIHYSKNH